MSAAAVTAAVSARSTLRPKPTVGRPDASSSALQPPSGPTATTSCDARRRSPLSWASTTSPGAPSPPSASKRMTSLISGSQTRRHWPAASRATRRSRSTAPWPRVPLQRTTLRSLTRGTTRSMPNSVSFWTTHSGRSPFVGANATVSAGEGAASNCTLPSPPGPTPSPSAASAGAPAAPPPPPPVQRVRAQCPAPSLTMTSSPARRRSTRPR